MKIDSLLLNNLIWNNKDGLFNEGSTFKGKILELTGRQILINIKGHGIIQANLENDVKLSVNDDLSFLVKSVNNNEIIIKPISDDRLQGSQQVGYNKEDNPISSLLMNLNIKETKLSKNLIETLMKYNIPLTENNIMDGIKILEKIMQLSNLDDEEMVIALSPDTTDNRSPVPPRESLDTTIKSNFNTQSLSQEETLENNISEEKVDIRNLIVIKKEDYNEGKDIKALVKEFLGSETDVEFQDKYIKITGFFLKNNIKPSLNNIKNLIEFNEDPIGFINKLKLTDKFLNENTHKKLAEDIEIINTKDMVFDKNQELIEIKRSLRSLSNISDLKIKDDIDDINNKIDFIREMNKNMSFIFLPINNREKNLDGVLTLIKENKNKKEYNGKINVYINLETHQLGNIKVSCQLVSNTISIRMNIRDQDLKLFKSTEKQLIEKISLIGYSLNRIDFVVDNNIEMIDIMVSNPNPMYILDFKV